jgi:magnesium dechelatase
MTHLNPDQLSVSFLPGTREDGPITPRAYTLTHSDVTGDLFLTIGPQFHWPQVAGWYTRLMRDEVLAEWQDKALTDRRGKVLAERLDDSVPRLIVHCHVSGGLVFGIKSWREGIFRYHLPMVLEAFRYGDQALVNDHPQLARAPIEVHFHYGGKCKIELSWGVFDDYRIAKVLR